MVVAVLSALAISGCGSYTRADYIQRAQGICTSTLDAARALRPPDLIGSAAERDSSLATYLDRLLPLMRSQLKRLHQLPRPPQSRAQERALGAYLAGLRDTVDQFAVLAAAARSGQTGIVAATESTLASGRLRRLARAYGLRTCSSSAAT